MMFLHSLLAFIVVLTTSSFAQQNSIVLLSNQLAAQLKLANQVVASMRTLELNLTHHQENLPLIHITYTTGQLSNYTPIAEIKAGFVQVDNHKDASIDNISNFDYLSASHIGQLCIEARFKNTSEQSDISPTLDGKIVAFCAVGGNLTNDLINKSTLEAGDPTHSIITGWVCYNPSTENQGFPMGTIDLDGDGTPANLLTGIDGPPWSMCSYSFTN
ncbi:MAG: hypothetical protein CMF46_00325 [Legionellales bacterium]|nr:hypothetical protein [Legionellales bacterium]|tara:strand:- start:4998 stop:5645 length:648 start_codon:yes stop_codon:yes gene_type:complete